MEQPDVLKYALDVLDAQGVTYMLAGSLAASVFGEGRMTHAIDVVIDLRPEQVEKLCAAFPAPEYYVSVPAARDAVARGGQFNVIHPASGNRIDFMIVRRDAWGRAQIARRREEAVLPDRRGYVAAPEDVIFAKLLYYQEGEHEKHLRDIASMIRISGDEIDFDDVARWAAQLGTLEIWQTVLKRAGRRT